jgi:hypothetical protein
MNGRQRGPADSPPDVMLTVSGFFAAGKLSNGV